MGDAGMTMFMTKGRGNAGVTTFMTTERRDVTSFMTVGGMGGGGY
jgi:hypothetical protein